jgi:transposase
MRDHGWQAILVNAPTQLREQLQPLSKMALIHRCTGLRPGIITTVEAATKHTLRSIARRWEQLNDEVAAHEKLLAELTTALAPQLGAAFGIGADTAAEMLIVAGDNPQRVRSEPAWARLCGVAPIPASSGMTTRHRLNPGGHRQANAALYRTVIVRMQHHDPTKAYVAHRPGQDETRDNPLPQTTTRARDLDTYASAAYHPRTRQAHRLTDIGASTRSSNPSGAECKPNC